MYTGSPPLRRDHSSQDDPEPLRVNLPAEIVRLRPGRDAAADEELAHAPRIEADQIAAVVVHAEEVLRPLGFARAEGAGAGEERIEGTEEGAGADGVGEGVVEDAGEDARGGAIGQAVRVLRLGDAEVVRDAEREIAARVGVVERAVHRDVRLEEAMVCDARPSVGRAGPGATRPGGRRAPRGRSAR